MKLAHSICGALDRGVTFDKIAQVLQQDAGDDATAQDFGAIMAAGVYAYCPQYKGDLLNWLNAHQTTGDQTTP